MSDATARLGLPVLPPTPLQPQVTHNEALVQLDALLFLRLKDRDLTAPPASPADGDAYLVKATASGAWTGRDGQIAYALDGGWRFCAPFAGLSAYVADEHRLIFHDGSGWDDFAAVLPLQNLPLLGINTGADTTNKLAVKSAALLFDNVGGGVQAKLNKHAVGDTASLLYQDNYSGRAEMGLCGDDDFHLKVSPDGSSWKEALRVTTAGAVGIGAAAPLATLHLSAATASTPGAVAANANASTTLLLTSEGSNNVILTSISNAATSRYSFNGYRARGSFAAPAAVQANDKLFSFLAGGHDGSGYQNAALIDFLCDGAPSTGHVPIRIAFTTGTNGSDRAERLSVTSAGLVGINTTPTVQLDVGGPVRVGQYAVAALPAASAGAGQVVFVSNESGGAVLAFSDGANWRRVTDRVVVS